MAWIDDGTDTPKWVPDDTPGLIPGEREGFVEIKPEAAYGQETVQYVVPEWAAALATSTPDQFDPATPEGKVASYLQDSYAGDTFAMDVEGLENYINRYGLEMIDPILAAFAAERAAGLAGRDPAFDPAVREAQHRFPFSHRSGGVIGDFLRTTGGGIRNLLTNPVVMAAITGGLAIPATAGAAPLLTPVQAAAATGALSGAASSENPFTGALRGGAIGGLTAGAGQYAGELTSGMFPDNPWLGGLARGAAAGGVGAALTGGDIFQSGAIGGITGALSGIGQGTPSLSDQEFDALMADTGLDTLPEPPVASTIPGAVGPLAAQSSVQNFLASVPEAVPGTTLPIGGQELDITSPGALEAAMAAGNLIAPQTSEALPPVSDADFEAAATEAALTEEAPTETKLKDLVKAAKKIHDLMRQMGFGQDVPEFTLPPQDEGESEEAYLARISDLALGYLGLDPNAMRAAGYEPGTPEYLDYVLAQADKVIAAAYGDADPAELEGKSVEELQQEFRGKSEQEMEALARALYVRGALGTKSFREFQIDPFTGQLEYLGEGGGAFGPTAGAQRGYARFLEQVAGQSAPEARRSIQGLLGRDIDIFGLEQARQDRTLQDMLAQFNAFQPEDEEDLYERRGTRGVRRGLLPATSRFWQNFR